MLKRPDGCPKHVWKEALLNYGCVMKETLESNSTPFPMLVRMDANGDKGTMLAISPELDHITEAIRAGVKALAAIIYQNRNCATRAVSGVALIVHMANQKKDWERGAQIPTYPCIIGKGDLFVCDPEEHLKGDMGNLQVRLVGLLEYRHERTGRICLCGWGAGLLHNSEGAMVYSKPVMVSTDRLSEMNDKCMMGDACPSLPLKTAEILVGNIDAHLPKSDPSLN